MTQSGEIIPSPPASVSIPLPETWPQLPAASPPSGQLRAGLTLLVAGLAFLLASFPAQNTDLWVHLANGRLAARGQFSAAGQLQAAAELTSNQTWLFDLCCFVWHQLLGGPALVFVKALLVAATALLVFRRSRMGQAWCLPALLTMLAVLAMGTRLLLQPATVSYFFLALALLLVQPAQENAAVRQPSYWPSWPLGILFVLWANVDHWFSLGLIVVALVWLGEILQAGLEAGSYTDRWRMLLLRRGAALLLLTAVCLLNPSHFHAFSLPVDLEGFSSSSATGAAGALTSPFQKAYFTRFGWSPAALAYFPLLLVSLFSFVLNRSRWSWPRFLPWLGVAVLSVIQVRSIPFFALVAAPVSAWNLHESIQPWLQRRTKDLEEWTRWGRTVTVLLGAILLVCAWPGWLQVPPYGPRHWTVHLSPSLVRGAEAVRRWHQDGKLDASARALHLSSESFRAFAWYCPDAIGQRVERQTSLEDWPRYMRSRGLSHVVLAYSGGENFLPVLAMFLADSEQWPLLYQEGSVAIFGFRDPDQSGAEQRFRGWKVDFDQACFHPAERDKAPRSSPEARGRSWWEVFWKSAPPRTIDREELGLLELEAEAFQYTAPIRHFLNWQRTQLTALIGASGGWSSLTDLCDLQFRLLLLKLQAQQSGASEERQSPLTRMALLLQNRSTLQQNDAPPALYYLAIRAARRALAVNPEDARAYLLLGESYIGLHFATQERVWSGRFSELVQLRRAQASAALNQAILLNPNLARAHLLLGQLYRQMGYYDLALKHLQMYAKFPPESSRSPELNSEQRQAQQAQFQEQLKQLAREVERRDDEFTVHSGSATIKDRATIASRLGLAGKALDLLLESHLSAFGAEGLQLEVELLLGTGRARDVREWLAPEHLELLGAPAYHWTLVRALAALGDYAQAEQECAVFTRVIAIPPGQEEPVRYRELMPLLIGKIMMNEQATASDIPSVILRRYIRLVHINNLQGMSDKLRQQADTTVLRGLIALEEGEVDEAEFAFGDALAIWNDPSKPATDTGLDFNARLIAQTCLEWLK